MQSKSKDLTKRQIGVIQALKSANGEWLSARDIGNIMYPDSPPRGAEISSIGCALIHLPEKCEFVEKQKDGTWSVYRWTGDNDSAVSVRAVPRCGTAPIPPTLVAPKPDAFVSEPASDSQLISEALLYYATSMVGKNPNAALRCAYLAGKGEFGPVTVVKSQPVAKSVKAKPVVKAEPVVEKELAVMPDDMDYDTFVKNAMTAYVRCEFTYPEAAKAADISESYFRDIVNGKAMPTRQTLKRAYSAIFSN